MAATTTADATTQSPILFAARGLQVDTRLRVFETEFHVHSTILKMGSAFFHKFLDSSDKKKTRLDAVVPGGFQYEWVTEIDEDGKGWSLIAAKGLKKRTPNMDLSTFKGDVDKAVKAFEILLSAMYHDQYRIVGNMLISVVELADYYCALPAVSKTLSTVSANKILDNWFGASSNIEYLTEHLQLACKLRHRPLFESAIIITAGNWTKSKEDLAGLNEFLEVVITVQDRIKLLVAEVQQKLFRRFTKNNIYDTMCRNVTQMMTLKTNYELPEYYRLLFSGSWDLDQNGGKALRRIISPLIKNNLTLWHADFVRGSLFYDSCFLCGIVKDEEIPWNLKETDCNQTTWFMVRGIPPTSRAAVLHTSGKLTKPPGEKVLYNTRNLRLHLAPSRKVPWQRNLQKTKANTKAEASIWLEMESLPRTGNKPQMHE